MDYEEIKKLFNFQESLSPEVFDDIFGKMGAHMWERYEKWGNNLLTFICTGAVSPENRVVVLEYMEKYFEKN